MPEILRPMLATAATALPVGPEWTYEAKWDGYRALLVKDRPRVRLLSRNLKDLTADFPTLVAAAQRLESTNLVVDGEIVAVDENGRPSFQALQHRGSAHPHVAYYVFDILRRGKQDFRQEPLHRRRHALAQLDWHAPLFVSEPLPGSASDVEHAIRLAGLEGVVAKRRDSRYEAAKRSDAWLKVKFNQRQEFVIGGYRPSGLNLDSVLVGYCEGPHLRHAGKVRAGFTAHTRSAVFDAIAALTTARCPFVNLPNSKKGRWGEGVTAEEMSTLRWVKPRVVAEVAFTEWTRDNNLRHASFVGLRHDKAAGDVTREV